MKMKEIIKPISFDMGMDVSKIKGHVRIELTDPKTGEVEVRESDNMMTNAMAEYFQNCGFLNFPNVDLNNMVIDLLGGVMAFDQPIDDDPTIVHVPAGCKMTCNGSVGATNSGVAPSELGSWVNDPEISGWIADNVYQQTYSYLEQQGNGTISTVCLTGKNYGYAGEGNCRSLVRHPTKVNIANLGGTVTSFSGITGQVFNIDFADSTVCAFAIEDVTVEEQTVTKGFVRKYRLPISKIALNGTRTEPILISETEVNLDDEIKGASMLMYQALGDNLLAWNAKPHTSASVPKDWGSGSWVQYLWTITPTGTISRETVVNTMGEDLYGLQAAHFVGNFCFFVDAFSWAYSYAGETRVDTTKIRVWDRDTDDMFTIQNPYGATNGLKDYYWNNEYAKTGWNVLYSSEDGRLVTTGNYPFIVDAVLKECYPNNAATNTLGNLIPTDKALIHSNGTNLYRDQAYIASIFEVDPPIVKDATRTMKIIYTITFPTGGENNA